MQTVEQHGQTGDERAADAARRALLPPVRKRPGPYFTTRCLEPSPEALRKAVEEFNSGLYFEQHETLELLWRAEPDDVRYLYQGILLVGVGLYHLQRGNRRGATLKLAQGIEKLRWFAPVCQGIDVTHLLEAARRCLECLASTSCGGQSGDRLAPSGQLPPCCRIRVRWAASPGGAE
jgi:hypothetical protein